MKLLPSITTLLFAILVLISCQETSKELTPALLTRSHNLQHGVEWDLIQNSYMKEKLSFEKNQNVDAALSLAHIYINEARITGEHGHYYPAALYVLNTAMKSEDLTTDKEFSALTAKSGVLLSLHQFGEAKEVALKAAQINPINAQVCGALVDAYVELGDYNQAITYADKMIAIRPDMRSYARISYLREIHGDIEGAIKALELSISAALPGTEDHAWAAHTLSELLIRYNRLDEAEMIYDQILEVRPDYPFAIAGQAAIHILREEYDLAKAKLGRAIAIIPEVGFYTSLAEIYKIQNETALFQATREEILLMLEDDTNNGHLMNMEYAEVYLELFEDPNTALQYALAEYEKRPDNIDVNRLLAAIYASTSQPQLAMTYLDQAASTNSNHPDLKRIEAKI